MIVEKSVVEKITISNLVSLDPIEVFLEDIETSKGRITISCYGQAWTGYWGGMAGRSIAKFFASCSVQYLANKMTDISHTITDYDAVKDDAKKNIIQIRRDRDIDQEKANDLWFEVNYAEPHELIHNSTIMNDIYGDEWWNQIPTKPNPDYEYLCRIVAAVREGLEEYMKETV